LLPFFAQTIAAVKGEEGLSGQPSSILDDTHQYFAETPLVIAGDFNFDLSREPAASTIARAPFNSPFRSGNVHPTTTHSRPVAPGLLIGF